MYFIILHYDFSKTDYFTITVCSLMVWYAKIPDNIQRVMSYWKTFLAYFRSPSILNVLQVETAMPGFLHTHYGAIRKSSCVNIRLSCHTTLSICRAFWNLPPSLLPVSLFFSSLFHPYLCQLCLSSLVCIDLWLRDLEIWGTVIWLPVTAGRCEEQTIPKQTPKPI